MSLDDLAISRAILDAHLATLRKAIDATVLIVGAGPAGLVAAQRLAAVGHRVVVLERQLAPGGGIWGGGMAMNEVVIQREAWPILSGLGCTPTPADQDLAVVPAAELAAALVVAALRAGAILLNLTFMEDVRVQAGHVTGLVVNRTRVGDSLPVDPITLGARAVIDATGHEAGVVARLRRRGLVPGEAPGERPMDAEAGERFVVEHTGLAFPGLWVAGMAVCATFGGERMGPIFGGMLLSGERVASQIQAALGAVRPCA